VTNLLPNPEPWYGVRIVYRLTGVSEPAYEERIVIVRAESFDDAIARAEKLSRENYESDSVVSTGYAVGFHIFDEAGDSLGDGVEVFSLIRKSPLTTPEYLDRFHDTGNECAATQ